MFTVDFVHKESLKTKDELHREKLLLHINLNLEDSRNSGTRKSLKRVLRKNSLNLQKINYNKH